MGTDLCQLERYTGFNANLLCTPIMGIMGGNESDFDDKRLKACDNMDVCL